MNDRHTAAEHSIITTYRKPIWRNFIKAVKKYQLISPGDRIAVCISGGKDSLLLAVCLRQLQRHSEMPFELVYLSMDPGYEPENRKKIEENAKKLEIDLEMFDSPIFEAVEGAPASPCHVCAAMRRGYLYKEAKKRGCNKIALGHHYDDVVQTVLLSMFYEGQYKTMMPKVMSDNWEGMELIRPLYMVREENIIEWQNEMGLDCLRCACKVTKSEDGGKRKYIKNLIEKLSEENPKLKNNIFASLTSVDLDTVLGHKPVGEKRIVPFTEEYGKTGRESPVMSKYVIGLDFGTLSGRAVIVDVKDGRQLAAQVYEYPHAVMDRALPDGQLLPPDWALQHPKDYLEVLENTLPQVIKKAGVNKEDIIALGIDFTSSTVLPVDKEGTPLCFKPEFEHEKHAYVKLWKHHGAQEQADRMTRVAQERNEPWLENYGGKVSSEWALPKLLEVMEDAPQVYAAMDEWVEALDWVSFCLTGKMVRSYCAAGYKFLWNKHTGFPKDAYFAAVNPAFERVMHEKVKSPIQELVSIAAPVTDEMAEKLNLPKGLPVCVGILDAHAGVPAVGMTKPGQLMIVMGTSACFMALSDNGAPVKGICGSLEDGILPGYFCYEAGQSCMGDHYAWLTKNAVPGEYFAEAEKRGMHIQTYLTELADKLRPGESGLLALDWWNGNRSVLVDFDLTGMILGLTLQTRAEEIYRALIEATAYGSRMIVETFRESGVEVNELFATGGISQKNAMAMQIYADVLNMPVRIAGSDQGPALGSAILAAAAVGSEKGGYDNAFDAIRAMAQTEQKVYMPIAENVAVYEQLFREYRRLHDYFGRGENDVMKRLKKLRGK